jgi:hypothetical protein
MARPHPTQAYSVGWGLRFKNEGSLRVAVYCHRDCERAVGLGRGDAGTRFHHIHLYLQTGDHHSDPYIYHTSHYDDDT